jgi:hypothetical protein
MKEPDIVTNVAKLISELRPIGTTPHGQVKFRDFYECRRGHASTVFNAAAAEVQPRGRP